MEETRKRIVKISKIIQVMTTLCMVLFGITAAGGLVVAFFPFQEEGLTEPYNNLVNSANLLPVILISLIYG